MTAVVAAVRPNEWNLPLFVHVLSSMVLVGSLVLALGVLAGASRPASGTVSLTRVGLRTLLFVAFPSWLVMRVSAQWIASEEGVADADAAWIGIGYATSEAGLLVLVAATILTWIALRRARRTPDARSVLPRIATILVGVLLLAYLVAVWAMTTKPD